MRVAELTRRAKLPRLLDTRGLNLLGGFLLSCSAHRSNGPGRGETDKSRDDENRELEGLGMHFNHSVAEWPLATADSQDLCCNRGTIVPRLPGAFHLCRTSAKSTHLDKCPWLQQILD